jgi:calpain-15
MCSNQLEDHQAANQTTRTDDSWTCPMCSYKNKTSQIKTCGICNHNRQQQPPTMTTNFLGSSVGNRQQSRKIQNGYECDETEARNIFNTIVSYCTRNRIHFVDDSFPPCDKSLFAKGAKPTAIRTVRWCTPSEICVPSEDVGLQWSVVFNKPSFNDIRQGLLGNCWFLSALAVISESEHLLNRIMLTKVFCDIGCYQIRLCMNGEWKIVIVDDLFPCDAYARLIYSKAVKKQLWVILIEKAMAKLHGSYDALVAG